MPLNLNDGKDYTFTMTWDKPPIGAKPYYTVYHDRIRELIGALKSYEEDINSIDDIAKWSKELYLVCSLLKRMEK